MLAMKTIGIMVERFRTHARRMHEGIIAYAKQRSDIALRLLEFSDINNPKSLSVCDGYIARIFNDYMADALRKTQKPIVDIYCGRDFDGILSVDENRRRVGVMAARHFIEHRFSQFAFCGIDGIAFSDGRRDAFVECLRKHHFNCINYKTPQSVLKNFEQSILRNDRLELPPDIRSLTTWLRRIPKPIAIFCAHDSRAYQVIQACHACGIYVPKEVAILGVDDDELTCNYSTPTISSINHNGIGIGFAAIKALDELLQNPSAKPTPVKINPIGLTTRGSSNIYPLDPAWLSDALVFIRSNISRNLTASDVYHVLGRSHTVVDRAFRSSLGTSVQKTIIDVRLEEAKRLIQNTTLSFANVAAQSGFSNAQHFCHSIHAAFGKSPTTLRIDAQR